MGSDHTASQVTDLLHRWKNGERAAHDELLPVVYGHLRKLAARSFKGERANHTLQHTALVHEAYLDLVGMDVSWNDRAHFYAIAARSMRRILVDHARTRRRLKRNHGEEFLPIEAAADAAATAPAIDLVELDDAIGRLMAIDPRKGAMVELRYFGGLTQEELAEMHGVSLATVNRDLQWARDWLKNALK
jgi:RNA polymerase sigma factor (TIGR02999 family)